MIKLLACIYMSMMRSLFLQIHSPSYRYTVLRLATIRVHLERPVVLHNNHLFISLMHLRGFWAGVFVFY